MKFVYQLLTSLILFSFVGETKAQLAPTVNMTLRSQLPFAGQKCANICGYAANGKEYALVGNTNGTGIVDVTDPVNPILLKQVMALNSLWREIKVYQHYAYVTTEAAGQGLQIIDLANLSLPTPDVVVKDFKGPDGNLVLISNIHSLHIDVGKGFLYAFGGNSTINIGGVNTAGINGAVVLDIQTDPWNPHYVGYYWNSNRNIGYIHDGFVVNDTLYGGFIYGGAFSIIDFRNKSAPVLVNTQTTPTAFTHNVWRSDNGKTIFTTDENSGGGTYVGAYDVSNPLNIKLLDKIRSSESATAVVHNTHVLNDFLVTSWYTEGVTIIDAHRPQNLVQVAQYDTYDGPTVYPNGAWGVYPYLPSGNLIVSNYTPVGAGLFVLTPQYVRACYLEGTVTDGNTSGLLSGVLVKINSTDMDKQAVTKNDGTYGTGQVTSGSVNVTYSKAGYISQTIVSIVLANGMVTIQDVQLFPAPVPIELVDIKAQKTENGVRISWETATEIRVKSFDIERSSIETPNVFSKIGEVKAAGRANTYIYDDEKPTSATHYYRLKINPETGDASKVEYTKVVSVNLTGKEEVKVTPSVSTGLLTIENGESVNIFNGVGQLVFTQKLKSPLENVNVSFLSAGTYVVKVQSGRVFFSNKIVILK